MSVIFSHKALETKNIQPYFVLSTHSTYRKKMVDNSVISHFYSFVADNSEGYTFAVPDACTDILFLCDPTTPAARICGSTISAKLVELQKNKRYFGVRFVPGFAPDFSSILPKELTDAEIALADIDPNASPLIEKIASSHCFANQINFFMQNYTDRLANRQSDLCQQLSQLMYQYNGDIRITELEELTGFSARYIYKIFTEQFGISPKLYCLILRFQQALFNLTAQEQLKNLTDLAIDLGYADQSHFLREFKKFAAISPKKFTTEIQHSFYQKRITYD
ncbi:AraC family transcriptional regulator [Entomomonas sp. E2T0]|uniref:helix-turn-helix domain-containing protein n=1 Tax=Entomomonas sp. E2T0 TaxID=2930213 RepID=UPI0022284DB7|nr:AraC family transcriptional regulator [Entomomonas sp. E2T0]UYZ83620.1 AraC family transcriptional regulator [Entomomonas sp. E2T0]